MEVVPAPQFAFYYPGTRVSASWIKNCLVLFDGIALLVPRSSSGRSSQSLRVSEDLDNGERVAPMLEERAMLRALDTREVMDQKTTEAFALAMVDVITSGRLDDVARADRRGWVHRIHESKFGFEEDRDLAAMIVGELARRRLMSDRPDNEYFDVDPVVRALVLTVLAQVAKETGPRFGLTLEPCTSYRSGHESLIDMVRTTTSPSVPIVANSDLEAIGVNVAQIPLGEVLRFKEEHGLEYRRYLRDLRVFVREVANCEANERETMMLDRREELSRRALELRNASRRRWKLETAATLTLGLAGASWTVATGDPVGGLIGLAAAGVPTAIHAASKLARGNSGKTIPPAPVVDAYSYLIGIQKFSELH